MKAKPKRKGEIPLVGDNPEDQLDEVYPTYEYQKRGDYTVGHHFTLRKEDRFEGVPIDELRDDFLKHERRKERLYKKRCYVVYGKLAMYFISKDLVKLKTIVIKNMGSMNATKRFGLGKKETLEMRSRSKSNKRKWRSLKS